MIISILFYLLSAILLDTTLTEDTVSYTNIVDVENTTQSELYLRAKIWLSNYYVDSKEVILLDDKESGIIIGKGSIRYSPSVLLGGLKISGYIRYTVRISIKDNKYKYEFYDFIHYPIDETYKFGLITDSEEYPDNYPKMMTTSNWRNRVWDNIKTAIFDSMIETVISLDKAMKTDIDVFDDDWD